MATEASAASESGGGSAPAGEAAVRAILAGRSAPGPVLVSADVLGRLIRDRWASWRAEAARDLDLRDLVVTGRLDLKSLESRASLRFDECRFEKAIDLDSAALEGLELRGCALASLSLRGATMGTVRIEGGSASGHLALDALSARRLTVAGARIKGALSLVGARVEREVKVAGARIGTGKSSIRGDRIQIGGTLRIGPVRDGSRAGILDGALSLVDARIDALEVAEEIRGPIDLRRSNVQRVLAAGGASVGAFLLDRADIGEFEITDGATLLGPIAGSNFTVHGDFRVAGEQRAGSGAGIDVMAARFSANVRLEPAFANAPLRLRGCSISGDLLLGGTLEVAAGNAVDISDLQCGRLDVGFLSLEGGASIRSNRCSGLILSGNYRSLPDYPLHLGLVCAGRATLGSTARPARIEGTLSLIGLDCHELSLGWIAIDALSEGRWAGVALAGRHLKVATLTRFGTAGEDGADVRIRGHVALDHASFGDDLRFAGAVIEGPRLSAIAPAAGTAAPALTLQKAATKGDVDFDSVALTGSVLLDGLAVDGDVRLDRLSLAQPEECTISILSMKAARIGGSLVAAGAAFEGAWSIDLSDASVGKLEDRQGSAWPEDADIALATFRYSDLETIARPLDSRFRDGLDSRLSWIERHSGTPFSPRPYRTLIAALESSGHPDEIPRVEMAALVQRRRKGSAPPLVKAGQAMLEWTSGYGHSPARAAITLVLLFLVGWAGTELAAAQGAFEASRFMDATLVAPATQAAPPDTCPWLEPPLYAIDMIMPVVAFGHENLCTIRENATVWHWAATIYRLVGWILVSIALLTFAGILRKEV